MTQPDALIQSLLDQEATLLISLAGAYCCCDQERTAELRQEIKGFLRAKAAVLLPLIGAKL